MSCKYWLKVADFTNQIQFVAQNQPGEAMEQQEEGHSPNGRAPATAASSGTQTEGSAQPVQLHSQR